MRPIELYLEGFTSFRREQRLDFSELDLFAITGATGAGKSSLLDAMTYALFGTTIRSGKQIGDLVSQGSETLKVKLQFSVGNAQYRVTRRWRYRPKTPENKVLLEAFQNGEWETIETSIDAAKKTIEQVLGMDFDTFTRVIVLPQGKFDEFLKGDTAKRREILRQLAGFEIFEQMRKRTNELAKLLKDEREMVERQLAELNAPAAEEVEEKRLHLISLEQELPTLNQAVMTAQKMLDEEEILFNQIIRLRDLHAELTTLNAKSSDIETFVQRLERAQIANHLQGDWVLVKEARNQCVTAQNAAQLAQKRLIEARSQLALQQQQLDAARAKQEAIAPQLKAREDALAAGKIYEEQRSQLEREVAIAQNTQQEKFRSLKALEKDLQAANSKIQGAGFQVAQATALLSQLAPGGKRLELLNQISPLLMEFQLIEKQAKTEQKQLAKAEQDWQIAQQNYSETTLQLEVAEVSLKKCQFDLETAEAVNVESARLDRVTAVRMSLNAGDICPVCGGVHPESDRLPPLPESNIIDVAPLRSRFATAQQVFQQAQITTTEAKTALSGHQQKQSELAQTLKLTQNKLVELQQQVNRVLGTSQWQAEELERELAILKDSDRKYREVEQHWQQVSIEFDKAQQAFQFAEATYLGKQAENKDAIAEVNRRQEQLKEVATKLYEITENQPYSTLAKALEKDKQNLNELLKTADHSYQTANNNVIQAVERYQQATDVNEQALAKNEQLNIAWESKLKTLNFTEETFIAAGADAKQQSAWETAIRKHRDAKIQLETRLKDLSDIIGAKTTDEMTLTQLRTAKITAEQKFKQANDSRAELLAWIQVAEQNLEQSERMSTQITTLTEHEQTYHTLAQNLKTNEFQAYILEHLEAELVASATLILQELTETRYALKIQDGEYWVEDNWNGGELRRVRTLSGGETFATSLSMALALSEKLSQGAQLGSLFLDEGFGTLDAETLESVTQILESLRQQDRLIGVITHVRGLGERLPTQIKVYKSPQGSKIEIEKV